MITINKKNQQRVNITVDCTLQRIVMPLIDAMIQGNYDKYSGLMTSRISGMDSYQGDWFYTAVLFLWNTASVWCPSVQLYITALDRKSYNTQNFFCPWNIFYVNICLLELFNLDYWDNVNTAYSNRYPEFIYLTTAINFSIVIIFRILIYVIVLCTSCPRCTAQFSWYIYTIYKWTRPLGHIVIWYLLLT